ncbi:MAG: redoxin family protein [Elusimicrobia bacterium]|nr:redoxin family protein [Elusimicrobiota bacterium]
MFRWLALAMLLTAACGRGQKQLPDLELPTLAAEPKVKLSHCPTEKCLLIYVAPWCPYCRAATGPINALRTYLKDRDIASRVVVGMDKSESVREYAREFGPDTLLDEHGAFNVSGVPHFIIADRKGLVIKAVPGMPPTQDAGELAEFFGLP